MLQKLAELRKAVKASRERMSSVAVGDLLLWYDPELDNRILRSRVTALGNFGIYVDQYPEPLPPMTVPWTCLAYSEYGLICVVSNPIVSIVVRPLPTRKNSIRRVHVSPRLKT